MRIIVCGCRDWPNRKAVFDALRAAAPDGKARNIVVVHGGCPAGVDAMAHSIMKGRCEVHKADWKAYGAAAGPIRNREMAESGADLCLAFWDEKSRGTKNMIEEAQKAGIPVKIVLLSSL